MITKTEIEARHELLVSTDPEVLACKAAIREKYPEDRKLVMMIHQLCLLMVNKGMSAGVSLAEEVHNGNPSDHSA